VGYYNTFVVRIWCNDSNELSRGYVQHVTTRQQRYFMDIDDLTDFILSHLVPPANDSGTGDQILSEQKRAENYGDILQDG